MKYLVTAAYADVVTSEGPQVYETTVDANSTEEAITEAQRQCAVDNGHTEDDMPDEPMLIDVFARPLPRPWVWIDGGLAQDHSEGVVVIDTDVSDFPDDDSVEDAQDTVVRAVEAGVPDYVIEAALDGYFKVSFHLQEDERRAKAREAGE